MSTGHIVSTTDLSLFRQAVHEWTDYNNQQGDECRKEQLEQKSKVKLPALDKPHQGRKILQNMQRSNAMSSQLHIVDR